MNRHGKRGGFSIILVLGVLTLMGLVLLLLSNSSREMVEQSSRMQADAAARNMAASALAWSRRHGAELRQTEAKHPRSLDASALAGRNASLQVAPAGDGAVRIAATIPGSPRPFDRAAVYPLPAP